MTLSYTFYYTFSENIWPFPLDPTDELQTVTNGQADPSAPREGSTGSRGDADASHVVMIPEDEKDETDGKKKKKDKKDKKGKKGEEGDEKMAKKVRCLFRTGFSFLFRREQTTRQQFHTEMSTLLDFIIIFGFTATNAFKCVQTCLVLVQYVVKYVLKFQHF